MKVLEKIKEYRKRKLISQEEMSDMLGMSQNNYGKIERGDTELTVVRLLEISKILEIPVFELVGEDLNEIVDLLKQTFETELSYYKMEAKKNEVIVKHLMKDLDYYREILFQRVLIDKEEFSRKGNYNLASALVTSNLDGEDYEEILKRPEK